MKKSTRVLSLVLAMLMLFSVFSVAVSAKEVEVAETSVTMTGGEVLYLKPNSNWTQASARFACYFFGSGNTWVSMTECENEADAGIYKVTVPSGSWTNVIFCRMNPSSSTNSWDTKWNQSGDLVYDGTKNLCTINSGQWDCGTNVTWSVFTETVPETEPPVTEEPSSDDVSEEVSDDVTEEEPTEEESTEEPSTEEPTEPIAKTVYCINSAKWAEVCAYAWTDGGAGMGWPGQAMTKTEDTVNGFDIYEITVNEDYANIIFNNNNQGSQTGDLTFMEGQYYDVKAGVWYASLDEVPEVDALATDRYLVGSFNGWSTVADEFKLNAEGETTGYVTLTLEAETTYEFKVVREGTWTSNATAITGTVEGLTFSSSVSGNAKLTTTVAGEYVFSFGLDNSQLSVTYPEVPTEEPTEEEPSTEEPTEEVPSEEESSEEETSEDEPSEDEPSTEEESTEAPVVIPAGYYLVGTLNGENCWFVDENSADRMFVANEGAEGEYMLDYTFVEGDAIKVVYFDGTAISAWYNDGGDNYGIGAEKAGEATVYFRPEGNADWSYNFFTVIVKEVPTEEPSTEEESTEEPTDDNPATGDQPTVPTEEPTEEPPVDPVETITIYFQNNWLWSDVKAYFWGSASANNPEWPGVAMEYYDNDGTYEVYYIEVPVDITGLIINGIKDDGTGTLDKTPDITEGFYDGICYAMRWDDGNAVASFDIKEIFPDEEPTEEEPSTEEPTVPFSCATSWNHTHDTITISWEVTGASSVNVYFGADPDALVRVHTTEEFNSSYTVEGLEADTTYYYLVTGIVGEDEMASYVASVYTTEAPTEEPTIPVEKVEKVEGVEAVATGRESFTVSWDAAEGVEYYWVFVNGNCYSKTTDTSMTVADRAVNTEYEVYVLAGFADKTLSSVSVADVVTVTTDDYELASGYESGVYSITLDWDVEDCTKTWIYYGTSADDIKIYASSTANTYTIPNLESNTVYYVKLAHLIDGVIVEEEVTEVSTLVDDTLIVTATEGEGALDLSWNAVGDTYKYWVTVESAEGTHIYSTTATQFTLTGDFADCDITVKGIGSDGMVYYYPVEA